MKIDRAKLLETIDKLENKKPKHRDSALLWGSVIALKEHLKSFKGDEFAELAKVTANDGNGGMDYAVLTLHPSAPVGERAVTKRSAGALSGRQVILGNLEVAGPLTVTGATVITGDLKASAVAVAETGILVVGGSLEARLISGDGWLWVCGDCKADLVLGYYEAGEFRVGKTLAATLGVMSNHGSFVGTNETEHWFDFEAVEPDDDDYRRFEALVSDKALVPEDDEPDLGIHRVDFRKLARLAGVGAPFLAPAQKQKSTPAKKQTKKTSAPAKKQTKKTSAPAKKQTKKTQPKKVAKSPAKKSRR